MSTNGGVRQVSALGCVGLVARLVVAGPFLVVALVLGLMAAQHELVFRDAAHAQATVASVSPDGVATYRFVDADGLPQEATERVKAGRVTPGAVVELQYPQAHPEAAELASNGTGLSRFFGPAVLLGFGLVMWFTVARVLRLARRFLVDVVEEATQRAAGSSPSTGPGSWQADPHVGEESPRG